MMSGPRWLMVVLIGLVTLRLLGSIGAEEVSDARLLNAYQDATNWLLYGRDNSNQRYSPLDQRSEEHTSELQSLAYLVCRLLLEKKKKNTTRRQLSQRI